MHGAKAFLHVAIAVIGLDVSRFGTGIDPSPVQRVFHLVAAGGMQRAAASAILVTARFTTLGTLEVR